MYLLQSQGNTFVRFIFKSIWEKGRKGCYEVSVAMFYLAYFLNYCACFTGVKEGNTLFRRRKL